MTSKFRPLRAEPPNSDTSNQPKTKAQEIQDDDDEDDYMTMAIAEPVQPVKETSIQRTQRLKKEALARGRPKSKAELAAAEAAAREAALSTSLFDAPGAKKNKGFAMMAKMGFSGGGLGKKATDSNSSVGGPGRAEPIRVEIKSDRGGIGMDSEKKRKLREEWEKQQTDGDAASKKARKLDPLEYRDRVARERHSERCERQLVAAQRMALQMHEEAVGEQVDNVAPDVRGANVLWRGLLVGRREAERQRQLKRELEESLSAMREGERNGLDDDDRMALGKDVSRLLPLGGDGEDRNEEEDDELKAFQELEPAERLRRVLVHLREKHRYCFWCKTVFPDEKMDGCPGVTEEDHD